MIQFLFTLVFTGASKQINLYSPMRGHLFLPYNRVLSYRTRETKKR